ncbi:MAG: pyrroline-5-carboxylate reductase dimerization domain-containing protein [Bacillota bacterium]
MSVGFIGMGNMGQMLVAALARSGVVQPGEIVISNRSPEKLDMVAGRVPGVQKALTNSDLARRCETIFLCMKPGETREVLDEIGPYITPSHLIVTINNTIEIPMIERRVRGRVAKVIPSVVQTVGRGGSLIIFGSRCQGSDRALLMRLFEAFSKPFVIEEAQARVASDLTSCGPAFLSYAFRALAEAARHYQPDLSREMVDAMIKETARATLELMEETGYSFDDIIAKVSTPGGVTADGIKVMDELFSGLWEQVIETTIQKENAKREKIEL